MLGWVLTILLLGSGSEELQIQVAARIVQKLNHPNLLLDPAVQWPRPPLFTPRLNSVPAGWNQFQFGDRLAARALQLPEVPLEEGHHLFILATGSYAINRGNVALTAAREFELKGDRASGNTGSLTAYNPLASQPPQTTPVLHSLV